MRTGALVVCVDDQFDAQIVELYDQLPKAGEIYTLREVSSGRGVVAVVKNGKLVKNGGSEAAPEIRVLLEECVNGPDPFCMQRELGFKAERFRELETEVEVAVEEYSDTLAKPLAG